MPILKAIGKGILLVVLAYLFFIAYTFSSPVVQRAFSVEPGASVAYVIAVSAAQYIILTSVWGAVFALPFAIVWKRRAFAVALICVAPVVVTIAYVLYQRTPHPILVALMFFAILCLVSIVPLFARAAHKYLERRYAALRAG